MNILEQFDYPKKKQDKEHFSHLIQMALADGIMDESERELLYKYGSKLGFTTPEIENLLEAGKMQAYIPPYELSKRFAQLYEVMKMVFADGKINTNEMRLATGIALKSGFVEQDIPILMALLMNGIRNGEDEEELFDLYKKRRIVR
ncbi:MAG: hypothetical protein WAO52_16990 [Prolixibacteraceae bacterium]